MARIERWILGVIVALLVMQPDRACAQDDLQAWSQYHAMVTRPAPFSFGLYGELRLKDDAGRLSGFFVGPTVGYQFNDYLSFGGAFKYILLQTSTLEQWQRLELEIDPQIKLFDDRLYLQLRNRGEFIRITDEELPDEWRIRARHRLTAAFSLERAGPLLKLYASNELFWGQPFSSAVGVPILVTENRLVPFGMQLRLSDLAKINLYYMLRSRSDDSPWRREHIIGTTLLITPPRLVSP
ncbi:MAG: DUF2490 domain-containing protein [Myxococcales bacterium]|nr:DUF2490 domain-containing protein [Myxococcales bacterium]